MVVILEIKMSLVIIKKSIYHCDPPYTRRVSSHRVLYLKFLSSYNICIIHLHVIEACLKVTIAMLYFFHSKNPSDGIKNIFNSISIYLEKKKILVNKEKKQRKINLFFDVMKNGDIFPSKVCHFQYYHGFLSSREMWNIRVCKEVRQQKLSKFWLSG